MFFNRKVKRLEKELQEVKDTLSKTEEELSKVKEFLSFYREKKKALQLIEDAEKECFSLDCYARLNYLKDTINQTNYRDYITKTHKGRICIDIHQMATTDYLNK